MEKSINNECVMSCNPADPRRSRVPGPLSEKFVTEDSTGVDAQAPVIVNATGSNKKLVQQAFHPSLFISRPRSASVGSRPPSKPGDPPPSVEHEESPSTPDLETPNPPTWQRVPINRNSKKRKLSTSPSADGIKTTNSFSGLDTEPTEKTMASKTIKPAKPPPIILYGIENLNMLTELLSTVAEEDKFTYKIINKNQLRISSMDIDTYKKLISVVRENGLIGHTFNRKDQRSFRIVIRNLHPTTPINVIKEEIEATGNIVTGEIINAKYGPNKTPTSTFFVNLVPGPNNKAAKELKYIFHQSIVIEDPKKRRSIVQCQRCQQYGHSKNYCMRPYRCVKCGLSHKTSECEKRDRNTPAQCALCNGPHPANYKGCEVYKEILARKNKTSTKMDQTRSNVTSNIPAPPLLKLGTTPQVGNTGSDNSHTKSYSETLRGHVQPPPQNSNPTRVYSALEQILLKQSEKFDIILQQMSTLMSLMVKLVDKLSSK